MKPPGKDPAIGIMRFKIWPKIFMQQKADLVGNSSQSINILRKTKSFQYFASDRMPT